MFLDVRTSRLGELDGVFYVTAIQGLNMVYCGILQC